MSVDFTAKLCPEFFFTVLGDDGGHDRVAFTSLLKKGVPTVVDFYNSG